MREILFRGKRTYDGKWVYGYLVDKIYGSQPVIINYAYMEDDCSIEWEYEHIYPETVGQYTGLTDKNGKKIFEGDICLCDRNIGRLADSQRFVIKFSEEYGAWIGEALISEIDASQFEMCEVIGNIYDNPELSGVDE